METKDITYLIEHVSRDGKLTRRTSSNPKLLTCAPGETIDVYTLFWRKGFSCDRSGGPKNT